MRKVRINNEKLAIRCEVCHKADCFDPQTNNCLRCRSVFPETNIADLYTTSDYANLDKHKDYSKFKVVVIFVLLAFTSGILFQLIDYLQFFDGWYIKGKKEYRIPTSQYHMLAGFFLSTSLLLGHLISGHKELYFERNSILRFRKRLGIWVVFSFLPITSFVICTLIRFTDWPYFSIAPLTLFCSLMLTLYISSRSIREYLALAFFGICIIIPIICFFCFLFLKVSFLYPITNTFIALYYSLCLISQKNNWDKKAMLG